MMLSEVSRDDYTRTFKSTSACRAEDILWCVFNSFGEKFWVVPSNPVHPPLSTPPRGTLRCWHVDKSSCLSQPCVLIRSSTSKDWIIACCPRACRSLHDHTMLQDSRGQAISAQSPGTGREKNWEQSVQSAGGRWMMCLHWHQHNWEILTQHCVRRWKIKFVHPLELEFLHSLFTNCVFACIYVTLMQMTTT